MFNPSLKTEIRHIRPRLADGTISNLGGVTIACQRQQNIILVSYAVCCDTDNFVAAKGREMALNRLRNDLCFYGAFDETATVVGNALHIIVNYKNAPSQVSNATQTALRTKFFTKKAVTDLASKLRRIHKTNPLIVNINQKAATANPGPAKPALRTADITSAGVNAVGQLVHDIIAHVQSTRDGFQDSGSVFLLDFGSDVQSPTIMHQHGHSQPTPVQSVKETLQQRLERIATRK